MNYSTSAAKHMHLIIKDNKKAAYPIEGNTACLYAFYEYCGDVSPNE
jgi:hypothetical protein